MPEKPEPSDLVKTVWRNVRRMDARELRGLRAMINDALGEGPEDTGGAGVREPRTPIKPQGSSAARPARERSAAKKTDKETSTVPMKEEKVGLTGKVPK